MTESTPSTRGNGRKNRDEDTPPLTDQLVLSTAGFAGRGVAGVRRAIDGTITTMDTLVLGAFDIADQVVASNIGAELTAKGIATARQAWTTGLDTARKVVADF